MRPNDWLQLHPLVRVALVLVMGLVMGNAIGHVMPVWAWLLACVVFLALTLGFRKMQTVQGIMVLCTVFCLGLLLMGLHHSRTDRPLPVGEQCSEAVVMSAPRIRGKVLQCDLWILRGPLAGQKVRASVQRDSLVCQHDRLCIGDGVAFRSVFQPIRNFRRYSNFDYRHWMMLHGYRAQTFIGCRQWLRCQPDLTLMPRMERLRLRAQKVRSGLLGRYAASAADNQDYAVVAAMVLGDKSFLSKGTKEVYSVSGVSHVLALSGLHLSIVFGLLVVLFGGSGRRRVVSLALVLLTVWMYVFLTGMSASIVRSAIMLTVYSLVSLLNRQKLSLNALAFTSVVMLLLHPLSLWDVGFQLSFMAVLSIILLYPSIYRWMPKRVLCWSGALSKLWGMVAVSVAAQVGTAPLVAYCFGRFSCYFLVANLVAVPLTVLILYTACLQLGLSFAPVLQGGVGAVLTGMAGLLNRLLSVVASWPGASIENIHMSLWQLVSVYVMIGCVCCLVYYLQKAHSRQLLP